MKLTRWDGVLDGVIASIEIPQESYALATKSPLADNPYPRS